MTMYVQVASALCASYIGGSVNFAAVSQSLGLTPGPLLAASMAADNIAMAAYLTAIMIIPARNIGTISQRPDSAIASNPAPPGKACYTNVNSYKTLMSACCHDDCMLAIELHACAQECHVCILTAHRL